MIRVQKTFVNILLITTLALQSMVSHGCFMFEKNSSVMTSNLTLRNMTLSMEAAHNHHANVTRNAMVSSNVMHQPISAVPMQHSLDMPNGEMTHHSMKMDCCKHSGSKHAGSSECSMDGCGLSHTVIPGITHIPLTYLRFETPQARAFSVASPPVETLYQPPIII